MHFLAFLRPKLCISAELNYPGHVSRFSDLDKEPDFLGWAARSSVVGWSLHWVGQIGSCLMTKTGHRVGVDIGGTFTDFVLYDGERRRIALYKCLTTPHDPSIAALEGLGVLTSEADITIGEVGEIIHGTTLVTNAIIERRGARLGLLTTQGFRDNLEMGNEQRYDIYDLFLSFPDPLVPRRHRLEIGERVDRDGRVITPLDPEALRRAVRQLVDDGVESIAVCFLHSYANPTHEQAVRALIECEFPNLFVSLSSDVVSELREYPRAVTTCANAYVQPLMDRYLANFECELRTRGFGGALRLMHSAGGLVS